MQSPVSGSSLNEGQVQSLQAPYPFFTSFCGELQLHRNNVNSKKNKFFIGLDF